MMYLAISSIRSPTTLHGRSVDFKDAQTNM